MRRARRVAAVFVLLPALLLAGAPATRAGPAPGVEEFTRGLLAHLIGDHATAAREFRAAPNSATPKRCSTLASSTTKGKACRRISPRRRAGIEEPPSSLTPRR